MNDEMDKTFVQVVENFEITVCGAAEAAAWSECPFHEAYNYYTFWIRHYTKVGQYQGDVSTTYAKIWGFTRGFS